MFRQRTSARKPGHDLLANFRQQFPEAAVVTSEKSASSIIHTSCATDHSGLNPASQHQNLSSVDHGTYHDQDPTPRATHESWRFTPSLLDPNSYVFNAFTNASSGYYTPTPGGSSTLFHSQAGDLHTPALGAGGIGTPLSIPNSGDALQAGTAVVDMAGFQALEPHHFHHLNPFIHNALPPPPPPQTYAPSSFVHQDTRYEPLEQDEPRVLEITQSQLLRVPSMPPVTLQSQKDSSRMQMRHTLPPNAENFRFHSTLNAPTAMIKEASEIPISYLNKGQAYSISVVDTSMHASGSKYRTFVRVSFEDDEQRQKPSVCWGLWKEGRGINEAHQRGGKLQAVEYVDAGQPAESDDKRPHIELESSSFDGFCVTWTPGANGPPEISLAVRFNFLSTDFSHSKGVKGIPVRLCAKTSALSADGSLKDEASTEVCYCKVKLFRDHGAERKLSNDIAHVKKTIEKLKQQLAQIESGTKDVGKRKRRSSVAKMTDCQRPGKVQKHKRTWSLSSASSSADGGGGEGGGAGASLAMTLEQDLQMKLQNLQAMFTSTLPISVLYLRGEDLDDPDRHPVSLPGDISPANKSEVRDGPSWQARSTKSSINDSMASPCPSSLSMNSQVSGVWQNVDSATASGKPHEQLSRVGRTDDAGILSGWIEALGVDASYRPPSEQLEKAVACVYVQLVDNSGHDKASYYRAIYLSKRTVEEFNGRVATKWGIPPSSIVRSIRVTREGLEIEIDDDSVRELKEGQDMRMSIEEVFEQPALTKREWDMSVDDEAGKVNDGSDPPTRGFVLRLTF